MVTQEYVWCQELLDSAKVYRQQPFDSILNRLQSNEEIIEEYTRRTETDYDFADIHYDSSQPKATVNINKASFRTLKRLKLNDIQINNLNSYIQKYGEITGIYELHLIEGFDSALILKLNPKLEFKLDPELHKITRKNLAIKGRHIIISRYSRILQPAKGFQATEDSLPIPYAGNQDKLLFKYSYNYYDRLRFGITMEKDPGESMKGGFDFCSFHILYRSKGFVKALALGNYNLTFGQGLTMNSGFSYGRNTATSTIQNRRNRISANTGANENTGLNGVAVTVSPIHHLDLTILYSAMKLDAGIYRTDNEESSEGYFTSITETGLHRTEMEIERKNALQQKILGSNMQYRTGIIRVGGSVYETSYSEPMRSGEEPYNKFSFSGKSLLNYGTDFSLTTSWLTLFSEFSGSNKGGNAYLAGVTGLSSNDFGFSLLYRNYGRNYTNFFSDAYSAGTNCINEAGFYAGFFANLTGKIIVTASADHYRHPWLKYRTDAPVDGKEYCLQLKYKLSDKDHFTARYTFNNKLLNPETYENDDHKLTNGKASGLPENPSILPGIIDFPVANSKHTFRLNLNYNPVKNLILRNRLDVLFNNKTPFANGKGYLVYQDIIYSSDKKPLSINLRYVIFDTDTYNERIYAYESDVLYSFSVPSYYYKGSRFYIMLNYDMNRNMSFWLRYSESFYPGITSTGTGTEEIIGNKKSEVKLQFILKI